MGKSWGYPVDQGIQHALAKWRGGPSGPILMVKVIVNTSGFLGSRNVSQLKTQGATDVPDCFCIFSDPYPCS